MYRRQTDTSALTPLPGVTRGFILFGFVVALLFWVGCEANPSGSNQPVANTTSNTNVANIANSNQTPVQTETAAARVPITLAVVDALLSDDTFVSEVKRSVQPSDEQLDKLKSAARDSVLKLNEDGFDDDARSTRSSLAEADKQIKQILGNEGGEKFLQLARKHWSGGDAAASGKPNAVPSDSRVVINAPAYRMDIFRDGQIVKSYKIGIGYPEFPLPVGLRTAKTIIFNPTWTPPDEPWVKGEFQPGKTVEAGSKKNPLGVLKIPIGLPSLIHGGKAANRLGTFASHGCAGLTNVLVQDFAAEIAKLSGSPLTPQQIKGYEQQRKETVEHNLAQPIPVELRYETLVVEDGKLYIFRDVYEHGTNTEENLNSVLQAFGISLNDLTPEEQTKVREALKQMALDAQGKPVDEDTNSNKKPSTSDKVTRTIKGKKEVVVEIAALKGKGYPAPVGMN